MSFTLEQHKAVWLDDLSPEPSNPFTVNICRVDQYDNRDFLSYIENYEGDDRVYDSYDSEVFFYTYDQQDYDDLFDPNSGHDFYLLRDEEIN